MCSKYLDKEQVYTPFRGKSKHRAEQLKSQLRRLCGEPAQTRE